MAAQEKTVTLFTTRVRQMMLEYEKCKSDNQSLRATIATLNERIEVLENQLREAEKNYNSMKTAKMLEVTDGDMEAAKARLAKLIRSVNKCITLLSEK
jgi:septal ring factor EnvC (AmiA/AmiB activator)